MRHESGQSAGAQRKLQLSCVCAGPLFLLLYLAAFWQIAGFLPPHPPTWSTYEVAAFYGEHAGAIRFGQILCLLASTLLFPWFAIISVQMARIEGGVPVLAIMQFGGGVLLLVFFAICSMLWIAAGYRAETDAPLVRLLDDTAWLMFVMVFPEFTLQLLCIAAVGLLDRSERPWLPRWVCFFNIWVGLGGAGGGIAAFFKTGPFAWNGLVGFWVPVALFAVWLCVMAPFLARNVER